MSMKSRGSRRSERSGSAVRHKRINIARQKLEDEINNDQPIVTKVKQPIKVYQLVKAEKKMDSGQNSPKSLITIQPKDPEIKNLNSSSGKKKRDIPCVSI